jgi:hypothetical protein
VVRLCIAPALHAPLRGGAVLREEKALAVEATRW